LRRESRGWKKRFWGKQSALLILEEGGTYKQVLKAVHGLPKGKKIV